MSLFLSSLKRFSILAAALAPVALVSGCAMSGTAPAGNSLSSAATINGTLHGGNQPIVNSEISLYTVGTNGYGSLPTLIATTHSANDAYGSFQFQQSAFNPGNPSGIVDVNNSAYSCPAGDPQMYLVARGGSTQGPSSAINNAAVFVFATGTCSQASSLFVDMNEVTTVATLAALQQYFNPSLDNFGYNGTSQSALGFANAVATIGNLVDVASGTAKTTVTPTSTLAGATITGTPEYQKINTIANILAACVNTAYQSGDTDGTCPTLFANAVPPASATATSQPSLEYHTANNVAEAAYFMLINPTDSQDSTKLANLAALSTPSGPFQPTVSATPTDWTIGITYGSTSKPDGTNFLLTDPEHVAIDAQGNVWVANFGSAGINTGNSITELSPTGNALVQVAVPTGTSNNISIDQTGNVWIPQPYNNAGVTGAGTSIIEYTGGTTKTFTTGNDPASVAFDGLGNAFVIEPSYKNTLTASGAASAGTLEQIPVNSPSGTVATTIATNLDTDFSALAIDSNYTIWVTGGGSSTTPTAANGLAGIYEFLKDPTTGYPTVPSATATVANAPGVTEPETGLVINNNGDVLSANYTKSTIGGVAGTSTTTIAAAPNTPITTTGLSSPQFMAVDGAGNLWAGQASSTGNVYAFSAAGAALSPTGGFVHTYKEPYGVAIDPSGNVWVGNKTSTASSTVAGFVTEIVGAAVPTVTPIAAGLPTTAGGPSLLGAKP